MKKTKKDEATVKQRQHNGNDIETQFSLYIFFKLIKKTFKKTIFIVFFNVPADRAWKFIN